MNQKSVDSRYVLWYNTDKEINAKMRKEVEGNEQNGFSGVFARLCVDATSPPHSKDRAETKA